MAPASCLFNGSFRCFTNTNGPVCHPFQTRRLSHVLLCENAPKEMRRHLCSHAQQLFWVTGIALGFFIELCAEQRVHESPFIIVLNQALILDLQFGVNSCSRGLQWLLTPALRSLTCLMLWMLGRLKTRIIFPISSLQCRSKLNYILCDWLCTKLKVVLILGIRPCVCMARL